MNKREREQSLKDWADGITRIMVATKAFGLVTFTFTHHAVTAHHTMCTTPHHTTYATSPRHALPHHTTPCRATPHHCTAQGIDKPDVRAVFHFQPAFSFLNYHQQAGRGGRDGKPTICVLFYSETDFSKVLLPFCHPH